jgi:hypothetical protein
MEDKKKLIEAVLAGESKEIAFEPVPEENESPLAQPVVEKVTTGSDGSPTTAGDGSGPAQAEKPKEKPTDAPEQEIDAEPTEEEKKKEESEGEGFTMPLEHAGLMADSIIGTVNNTVLEIGGGYFVTIRKHKDFYDYDEVIQVIDEQNVKNIKRLKLDEEDKALIRPLLIHILRKKAAALTPEKQLLMVIFSILIKKAKVIMEMRSENEILVERIRDIIRKENAAYPSDTRRDDEQKPSESNMYAESEAVYEDSPNSQKPKNNTGLPDEVLEVMD